MSNQQEKYFFLKNRISDYKFRAKIFVYSFTNLLIPINFCIFAK